MKARSLACTGLGALELPTSPFPDNYYLGCWAAPWRTVTCEASLSWPDPALISLQMPQDSCITLLLPECWWKLQHTTGSPKAGRESWESRHTKGLVHMPKKNMSFPSAFITDWPWDSAQAGSEGQDRVVNYLLEQKGEAPQAHTAPGQFAFSLKHAWLAEKTSNDWTETALNASKQINQ